MAYGETYELANASAEPTGEPISMITSVLAHDDAGDR